MKPEDLRERIAHVKKENVKLAIWRSFSDNSASNSPPNGEFSNRILEGVTVGIKDIIDVAGLPTRCGSAIFNNAPPATQDAACVAQLRQAGAIIIGKTVTTELATFVPAETINPRFPLHTPGGSSSGSAAAVAAGHVDLALGTQTAGSIIRPAAYCGVIGFKPTFGLVPRGGVLVQSPTLDTVGVFALDIGVLQRWLSVVTNKPMPEFAPRPLRLHFITNHLERASADMRAALTHAAARLRAVGHDVALITLPKIFDDVIALQQTIQNAEAARAYEPFRIQHRAYITPALLAQLDVGAAIPENEYQHALAIAREAQALADELLAEVDAWVMPAATSAPPLSSENTTGDPFFNRLASVLGVPCLSLTAMTNRAKLPLGIQLIGRQGSDSALLNTTVTAHITIEKSH